MLHAWPVLLCELKLWLPAVMWLKTQLIHASSTVPVHNVHVANPLILPPFSWGKKKIALYMGIYSILNHHMSSLKMA